MPCIDLEISCEEIKKFPLMEPSKAYLKYPVSVDDLQITIFGGVVAERGFGKFTGCGGTCCSDSGPEVFMWNGVEINADGSVVLTNLIRGLAPLGCDIKTKACFQISHCRTSELILGTSHYYDCLFQSTICCEKCGDCQECTASNTDGGPI